MTETSYPWAGTTTGDKGPYSDDQWSDMFRYFFVEDRTEQGVIRDIDNELAVSGVASPVDVATGLAIVDGKFYKNDAVVQVTIPTPTTNPRIDRIVLRKSWAAQTVRIERVAGTEAASPSPPALTQTDGTTWEISLAQVYITTGGTITVTDERTFVYSPLSREHADPRIRYVEIECYSFRDEEPIVVGDGSGWFHVPADLDGWDLVECHAEHRNAGSGSTNKTLIQIHNATQAADMLTTKLQIDAGETGSDTAATAYVIDTANDDITENDMLRVDVDEKPETTDPEGLIVTLGFLPP